MVSAPRHSSSQSEGALSHNAQVFVWGGSQGGHAAYATDATRPITRQNRDSWRYRIAPSDLVATECARTELGPP